MITMQLCRLDPITTRRLCRRIGATAYIAIISFFIGQGQIFAAELQDPIRSLNSFLDKNDTEELLRSLRNAPDSNDLMVWLEEKASQGHVVAQYELASRLSSTDKRIALEWFAKARFSRILDEHECRDKIKPYTIGNRIDSAYSSLEKLSKLEFGLFSDAVAEAIKTDIGNGGQKSSSWICASGKNDATNSDWRVANWQMKRSNEWPYLRARTFGQVMEKKLNANLNPENYRIVELDSKYWKGKWNPSMPFQDGLFAYWLSEKSLLFGNYRTGPHGNNVVEPIYTWDLESGDVKKYNPGVNPCYFKGYISYYVPRDENYLYKEGRLGEEREVVLPEGRTAKEFRRFRCQRVPKEKLVDDRNAWLLESGGRLKREDRFKRTPAEYFHEGSDAPTVFDPFEGLSEPGDALLATSPVYSEYLNASVMIARTGWMAADNPPRLWILYPSGKIERYDVPKGPWASASDFYFSTKLGWLVMSSVHGLYLFKDDGPIKLVDGDPTSVRVSPSGCRIAYLSRLIGANEYPLRVIDICEKGD